MYVITLNHKPATVQQLHNNEGWTWYEKDVEKYHVLPTSYIAAPTARQCREAYDTLLCICWSQKQSNVRTAKLTTAKGA